MFGLITEQMDNYGQILIEKVPNYTNLPSLSMGSGRNPKCNRTKVDILNPSSNSVKNVVISLSFVRNF